MQHLTTFGQRAMRVAAQLLPALAVSLVFVSTVSAQPLAQADGLDPSTQACSLVTQEEAGMALGADPGPGALDSREGGSGCTYGTMPGIVMVNVVAPGGQADYNHILGQAQPGQTFDITGVGDGAFGLAVGPTAGVWFYKGDSLVAINVMAGSTGQPPTDMAIQLATTAASRI
jgi:hypothetical protein